MRQRRAIRLIEAPRDTPLVLPEDRAAARQLYRRFIIISDFPCLVSGVDGGRKRIEQLVIPVARPFLRVHRVCNVDCEAAGVDQTIIAKLGAGSDLDVPVRAVLRAQPRGRSLDLLTPPEPLKNVLNNKGIRVEVHDGSTDVLMLLEA